MSYLTYLGLSFVILVIAVLVMTLGLWFGRSPIKGSCGGMAADGSCATCGGDRHKCTDTS